MFLLAVKRKFIISLTILMVVLSWGGALVFHTLLPRYYFAWYTSIQIFFYLFDEDDVEHLDYVRLCSGGGTSSTVIYRNLHGILYYLSDF